MYLTALPVDSLDFCSIDHWDPRRAGAWKGYQRSLQQEKIHSLAKYLERHDSILPVAGLLNVRQKGKLKFSQPASKKSATGILTIQDGTQLWVVDMQHRLEGIKTAHKKGLLKNFSVPVLITEGLSSVKEAAQFYVINSKSRKMGVDLTRRLLIEHDEIKDITDVNEWELAATQISIILNQKLRNNPWYKRIREPESESQRDQVATEKSFVPSLKWLLTSPGNKKKKPAYLAKYLAIYWEAIRFNIPKAFETPRGYLIQKTPGYMAFHKIAPIVLRKYKKPTLSQLKKLFTPLGNDPSLGTRFWDRKNLKGAKRFGNGQGAYHLLAMELKAKLKL